MHELLCDASLADCYVPIYCGVIILHLRGDISLEFWMLLSALVLNDSGKVDRRWLEPVLFWIYVFSRLTAIASFET